MPQPFESTREATWCAVIGSTNYRDDVLGGMRETSGMLTKKIIGNTQMTLPATGSATDGGVPLKRIPNVLVPLSAADDSALLKRLQLARAINVSARTVDNWQRQKKIPFIRISTRCVRFHLPSVLAALRRFEVKEAGRRA